MQCSACALYACSPSLTHSLLILWPVRDELIHVAVFYLIVVLSEYRKGLSAELSGRTKMAIATLTSPGMGMSPVGLGVSRTQVCQKITCASALAA